MPDAAADAVRTRGVVLIGDMVSSRGHPDRAALQSRLAAVLEAANETGRLTQPLRITVGDEFQGAVQSLPDALGLGLDLRLDVLPDVELRIGIGVGSFWVFDPTATPISQDGPAWWAARKAVETAGGLAGRPASRHVRSWTVALDDDGAEPPDGGSVPTVNGYLMLQDFVLSTMRPRQLRLLAAFRRGEPQREIASREGITQSAVSQALSASGAQAITHALAALSDGYQPETDISPSSAES